MTQIEDELLDDLLANYSGNEIATLLAINLMLARGQSVSIRDLIGKAGTTSRSMNVSKYVKRLVEDGLVYRNRTRQQGSGGKFKGIDYGITHSGIKHIRQTK